MAGGQITISAADKAFIQAVKESGTGLYRAYDRLFPYLQRGTGQYFWFEQAALINRKANGIVPPSDNNLASTYIIAHSNYGLAADGITVNLADTSNNIAQRVIDDVLREGAIPPLDEMLKNDIAGALDVGNQTIGGWGGSFYYWDVEYTDTGKTVGQAILENPVELEKFLASSVAASIAVAKQETGEVWDGGSQFSAIMTGLNDAQLPIDLKAELILLAGKAFVSRRMDSDLTFGGWTYSQTGDRFFRMVGGGFGPDIGPSQVVIASGKEESDLRKRLAFRTSLNEKGVAKLEDVFQNVIYLQDVELQENCFLPHTPILLADGTTKPIAAVRPGDMVLSHDKRGKLLPRRVTRTFVNDVAHVLDFHGTGVTPGHAFLCGAGRFQGRHVPLLDILRDDGAVVRQDGSLMRAATGCAVGSDGDRRIEVAAADGATGWVRAATRLPCGATVAEVIARQLCS